GSTAACEIVSGLSFLGVVCVVVLGDLTEVLLNLLRRSASSSWRAGRARPSVDCDVGRGLAQFFPGRGGVLPQDLLHSRRRSHSGILFACRERIWKFSPRAFACLS